MLTYADACRVTNNVTPYVTTDFEAKLTSHARRGGRGGGVTL